MSDMRFNIYKTAPELVQGLISVEQAISETALDKNLNHLIKLRASQINGCAYCVEMHTREGREDGETNARLDQVIVWRDTKLYSDAERAALAWTEALTDNDSRADLDRLYGDLQSHYDAGEIAAISMTIAAINAWNRLGVAAHGSLAA